MMIVYVENIKESMDKLLEFISWLAMFWIQSQYLKNPQLKKTDISIGQEKKIRKQNFKKIRYTVE